MKWMIACLLLTALNAPAQNTIPFNSPRWKTNGDQVVEETFQGKPCLKLVNGMAILKDANFKNGIIEFDMAVTKDRYFPGVGFRMVSDGNTEEFYIRPHQAENPDALQYYPQYNGAGGWQLYYGEGFGNAHNIPLDKWFHIKMLVKDTLAEVYFDSELQPALFIKKLYRPVAAGMIALENVWQVPARFANFTYTATDEVTIQSKPIPGRRLPESIFKTWQVSTPFDEKLLAGTATLPAIDSLSWQTVNADGRGIVNLDKLAQVKPGKNSVLAKLVIHSEKDGVKKFSFGFSDRVNVYYNGKLLYSGHDEFLSRDYRFLGTVGAWDAVYLDLKKGDNEVVLAVSENFGGWGVAAMLEDL